MKITLEPYSGGQYTASNDAEHISEVINMFRGLLVQTGYHPRTVEEYIPGGESGDWFPDTAANPAGSTTPPTVSDPDVMQHLLDDFEGEKRAEQVAQDYFDSEEEYMN